MRVTMASEKTAAETVPIEMAFALSHPVAAKIILWSWISFYVSLGIIQHLFNNKPFWDYMPIVIFLLLLLHCQKIYGIPPLSAALIGSSALLHSLGTIPINWDGEIISLYNSAFFLGNYDIISHFLSFVAAAYAILLFLMANGIRISLLSLAILLFVLAGMGAFIEMTEFASYYFFGYGWGVFAFGDGDNSSNFGPWGDSMTDSFANLLGILVGMVLFLASSRTPDSLASKKPFLSLMGEKQAVPTRQKKISLL